MMRTAITISTRTRTPSLQRFLASSEFSKTQLGMPACGVFFVDGGQKWRDIGGLNAH
jgi:hypothetical protein